MTTRASSLVCPSICRLLRGVSTQSVIPFHPILGSWQIGCPRMFGARALSFQFRPRLLFTANLSEGSHKLGENSISQERTVFVTNFKWPVTEKSLREHFEKFGEVKDYVWGKTKLTKRARGFALVQFQNENDFNDVLRQPHDLFGHQLTVKKYQKRPWMTGETFFVKVRNVDAKWRKEELMNHFSKYGSVVAVDWPINIFTKTKQDTCFVQFSSTEQADKASRDENQLFGDQKMEVIRSNSQLNDWLGGTNRLLVSADTTVESVANYFTKFGSIEAIWGNFSNVAPNGMLCPTFSLTFKEASSVQEISKQTHLIDGEEVFTLRGTPNPAPSYPFERRIVVDKIPDEVTKKDVTEYFDQFGIVQKVYFATVPETDVKLTFTVTFERHEAVRRAIAEENHSLRGQKVRVRSVGYRKYNSILALLKDP